MNIQKLAESWEEIISQLKSYDDVNNSQVDAFFNRLSLQALSHDFILITTENEFIKSQIEQRFLPQLRRALHDLQGNDYTIEFFIEPSTILTTDNLINNQIVQKPLTHTKLQPTTPKESNPETPTIGNSIYTENNTTTQQNSITNSSLTFDNYVIGESNNIAYSYALSVAETPGKQSLNPLFIYGRSGLGKTHLLHAIKNYIEETKPLLRVKYIDAIQFVNDYTNAATDNSRNKDSFKHFTQQYVTSDVLLIDDIQVFQGKGETINMVFQIFNQFITSGKQVVLSADRSPSSIDLDERYTSRFNSGASVNITAPSIETKLGIIKNTIKDYNKNENAHFTLDDEISSYIAEISGSNVRDLISSVYKIIYFSTYSKLQYISIDSVKELLKNHFSSGITKKIEIRDIQKTVAHYYKVSALELQSSKRSHNIAWARHVAIYLCREKLDLPYATTPR